MLFITYEGFKKSLKNTPNKIRLICIFVFTGILLRYLCLLGLFLARNIGYLYILKPFYFLNLICIPIAALITLYILIRSDKIKFSNIFLISGVLVLIYSYLIYSKPIKIEVSLLYGYYMEFIDNPYIYVVYMLASVLFVILTLLHLKENIYKIGAILVVISAVGLIFEGILNLSSKGIFETLIISDVLWIITLNYGISKLKKSGR
jgi:hypothetical protein